MYPYVNHFFFIIILSFSYYMIGMIQSSVFGPSKNLKHIPFVQQIDRYQGHVRYCKLCQNALVKLEFLKKWGLLFALFPIILTENIFGRILGIFMYCFVNLISTNLIAEINGGEYIKNKRVSAAQMNPF